MKLWTRWAFLGVGTALSALGMVFLDRAAMGQATTAVLWDGMSRLLPITIGQACYITSVAMVLFSLFYDRSQVRWGTVVHFLLYGWVFDACVMVLPRSAGVVVTAGYILVGMGLLGFGVALYAYADLGRGPYEGIGFALCKKNGWQMQYVRAASDGVLIGVGWLLGGQVGLVTLLNLFCCGWLIQKSALLLDRLTGLELGAQSVGRGQMVAVK